MNRQARALASLVLGMLYFSLLPQAEAQRQRWTQYGVRPMGMGNAFVAVSDDFNALFYNPAGLARLKDWSFEVINPYVGASVNSSNLVSEGMAIMQGGDGMDGALDLLESNVGIAHGGEIGLVPHFVMPGFGFALATNLDASMMVTREPNALIHAGPTIIAPVSFAHNFLNDRLSLGATFKYVYSLGVNQSFGINEFNALMDPTEGDGPQIGDFIQGGSGIGADIGMLFTPIKTMEPTLGLSITDLGGTTMAASALGGETLGAPPLRQPSLNMGFSMRPFQTGSQYLLAAIDMHNINQPIHFSKKLNAGLEYGFGQRLIKLQAGVHQGYFTAGLQLDVWVLNLRLATYAHEYGAIAGSMTDRRYLAQLKLLI